ncbi:Rid family hydrolase [Paraburkholderia sp.]|jgi:enamine deaminase RidA (YjgF/YER057c/UK114 family)|uniref:Rid family hydrolase n=1 Tax=Paraburkholderia sp. TaxID=1926495 RepID=UPI003C7E9BEE
MTTSTDIRQKISSGGAYENVFGYSRAVRVGQHLHISGTCAPATHERSDAYTQTRAILDVIGKVLAEAGMSEQDVVRTVVYVRDINDADTVAKAHLETFDAIRPASTLIQVDSMLRPWQKVEIEIYAIESD